MGIGQNWVPQINSMVVLKISTFQSLVQVLHFDLWFHRPLSNHHWIGYHWFTGDLPRFSSYGYYGWWKVSIPRFHQPRHRCAWETFRTAHLGSNCRCTSHAPPSTPLRVRSVWRWQFSVANPRTKWRFQRKIIGTYGKIHDEWRFIARKIINWAVPLPCLIIPQGIEIRCSSQKNVVSYGIEIVVSFKQSPCKQEIASVQHVPTNYWIYWTLTKHWPFLSMLDGNKKCIPYCMAILTGKHISRSLDFHFDLDISKCLDSNQF